LLTGQASKAFKNNFPFKLLSIKPQARQHLNPAVNNDTTTPCKIAQQQGISILLAQIASMSERKHSYTSGEKSQLSATAAHASLDGIEVVVLSLTDKPTP
jgi:hypothetical protein